jgi:LPXTG-motif cell wall-anchored protein
MTILPTLLTFGSSALLFIMELARMSHLVILGILAFVILAIMFIRRKQRD